MSLNYFKCVFKIPKDKINNASISVITTAK